MPVPRHSGIWPTLAVLEGGLPRRALALVLEWAQEHRAELLEDSELCSRRNEAYHAWALALMRQVRPLMLTWDAVLVEAVHFMPWSDTPTR